MKLLIGRFLHQLVPLTTPPLLILLCVIKELNIIAFNDPPFCLYHSQSVLLIHYDPPFSSSVPIQIPPSRM